MTITPQTREDQELEALYRDLAAVDLRPLWTITEQLLTPTPKPKAIPWLWSAATMKPLARRAIQLVPVERGGERRVLSLQNPGLASSGPGGSGAGNPLLVGAPQQKRDQGWIIEQPGAIERIDQNMVPTLSSRNPPVGKRRAQVARDFGDQTVEHGGHQRPLLLGQPLRSIEKEVRSDRWQTSSSRAAHEHIIGGRRRA